ncbi:putative 2OG-Fe(II) oxygenase [Streptosporangium sp. NBC_01495]|uniref:putative 2OG-Fe(II) oxygenase n=1 Tax=Streptosporangium sp. NBC_01495 TaxID=2903899 RepID=UPI002E304710|nr:putative 2OG-Fe(II) oxygenase [Streptosporangium sp. NBC_01495]
MSTSILPPVTPIWPVPIYQEDFDDAEQFNPALAELILTAQAAQEQPVILPGGLDARKSSEDILTWNHPAVAWLRGRILGAVTAMATDMLGEAARNITAKPLAEGWAVTYAEGASLLPHTHHSTSIAGVYYIDPGTADSGQDPGFLQLLDPRPGAVARGASSGVIRVQPAAGRMVAFPGWLNHQVRATASKERLRICVAFNVSYNAGGAA